MFPSSQSDTPLLNIPLVPRWAGFIAACIGMFMAILDIQVVVTAIKSLEEALKIGADRMSWIQTAYIIAEVIAIPLTGLLLRVFSMRWLFTGALSIFTLSSIGCAMSQGFTDLLLWRILQGFAGGVLIPLVFTGIFLLFPQGFQQTLATTLGGILAVLAPTLGPVTGGWLTEHYSWHWLFLINVIPGILAVIVGSISLPMAQVNLKLLKELDWLSLVSFGAALALLVVGLKEAPERGWASLYVLGCFAATILLMTISVLRPNPAIMFHLLKDRALAFGCALSFLLGFALFAAVYIMPVFLGFVRNHGPLQIGIITLVMGTAQIITAPIIVQIDRYVDARWLAIVGFLGFGIGLALNTNLTVASDYDEVFWPQAIRGALVALCILPPIRFALALMPKDQVSDASGLFNLVRNIGGVVGIALCDTIMFGRTPEHADRIMEQLQSDPEAAARALDLPVDQLPAADDPTEMMSILDLVEDASLTMAINECWWMLAAACFLAVPLILLLGPVKSAMSSRKLAKLQSEG
jgi:MFS transporter, DHA2 family, multidrug resistance protein